MSAQRKWYAEDVASLFEMRASGVCLKSCGRHFNVSWRTIQRVIENAKRGGFAAYPKRED